jgi:hypothetical protein
MSTKHTPGPWHTEFNVYGGYDCMTDAWDIKDATDASIVAVDLADYGQPYNDRPWRSEVAEANARLIAAAPELLEALRILYEETADYIRINNLGDVHHNRSMQFARDVLAKAGK